MTILGLLVLLLVLGLVFWGARTIMGAFSIPPPVQAVVTVLLVFVAVLVILQAFGITSTVVRLR
jgi:hypothetical protein